MTIPNPPIPVPISSGNFYLPITPREAENNGGLSYKPHIIHCLPFDPLRGGGDMSPPPGPTQPPMATTPNLCPLPTVACHTHCTSPWHCPFTHTSRRGVQLQHSRYIHLCHPASEQYKPVIPSNTLWRSARNPSTEPAELSHVIIMRHRDTGGLSCSIAVADVLVISAADTVDLLSAQMVMGCPLPIRWVRKCIVYIILEVLCEIRTVGWEPFGSDKFYMSQAAWAMQQVGLKTGGRYTQFRLSETLYLRFLS